jgi:uncharacterized membrane protein YsdA (DUF1294 family)
MAKLTYIGIVLCLMAVTNLISFLLMRHDKRCAQRGLRRVPESKLFLAAACFGGLGGVIGMHLLRHKTKHWYFKIFFPLILAIQVVLLGAGMYLFLR